MAEQAAPDSSAAAAPQTPDESAAAAAYQPKPAGAHPTRRGTAGSVESAAASTRSTGSSMKAGSRRSSKMGSALRRRSSGLFAAARASFVRNRGQSGASVETLRGNTGAAFEGYATVHRGDGDGALAMFDLTSLCCGRQKGGLYFLLIKGSHCFVFKDEAGKTPKYAIELINRRAVVEPTPHHVPHIPHPGASHDTTYTTINLETSLGDVEYKFTFANMEDGLSTKFCNSVAAASNEAATEQVRKRLGHEGLLHKRASVKFADAVGKAKTKDQPEAPVGAGEVMAGMPTPMGY